MDLKPLHLDAIDFPDVPTEEELIKTLIDIEGFLTKMTGVLLAAGKYPALDQQQKISKMLGACATLRGAKDAFQGMSNIAVPQIAMQPGHRQ